jgi:lysozyme
MTYDRATFLAELERDEGLKLKPYRDTATPPRLTIGIGRNLDDVGLSADEARALCGNDIDRAEAALSTVVPYWRGLSENRQRVLLNMVFNVGPGKLAGFKKMLKAIEDGDYDRAATEMMGSLWAEQVGERARRLAILMQHG